MEGYDYEAAASTIKTEDIARDETNQQILRRLKRNDPDFDHLWVRGSRLDARVLQYTSLTTRVLAQKYK